MRHSLAATLFCCVLVAAIPTVSLSTSELGVPTLPHYGVRFTDLVILGSTLSVEIEYVRAADFRPQVPAWFANESIRLSRLKVSVSEVLKGECSAREVVVLADESNVRSGLFQVGREIVVSVYRRSDLGDDVYEMMSPGGYYASDGDVWMCNRVPYRLDDVRAVLDSLTVENMTTFADLVVTGTIKAAKTEPWLVTTDGPRLIQTIEFEIDGGVKGGDARELVNLRNVIGGAHLIEMPRDLAPGQRYYAFLVKDDGAYRVVGGVNGFLRVSNGQLIYRDSVTLGASKQEMDRRLSAVLKSADR